MDKYNTNVVNEIHPTQVGTNIVNTTLLDMLDNVRLGLADSEHNLTTTVCPGAQTIHNFCPDCDIPMEISGVEYICKNCSMTIKNEKDTCDHDAVSNNNLHMTTGRNRGKIYNINSDYTRAQKKAILDQLTKNASDFAGSKIPQNVLNATATQYNNIQKFVTEDEVDGNGNVKSQKKFVRRGTIKDEVIATLIKYEGRREGIFLKNRDIASFMKLPTCGFARGEDIVRTLRERGEIDLPMDDEPVEGFTDRYLEALGIEEPLNSKYSAFIKDLIDESERLKIGMNSQISSKVVGSIWLIIVNCNLNITAAKLEKAADDTKKNTFVKFYKSVIDNMTVFSTIFTKHSIPKVPKS